MLMRILCAVLLYQGMLATAGLAQDTKQEAATTTCTFEDGSEISVRYIPVETNREKIQNGKVWAPGGSPMVLFTPAALTLEKSQIPAGAFSLYLIPQKDRWTLVVNKNVSAGNRYDERQDIARAAMEMGQLGEPTSTLELSFGHMGPKHCSLRVYFGKTGGWAEFLEK
ncbi:MAG TPA: DUF2911 domain-containing protein [Terriglobales bacterium]|nr:DUF2911 domain-containing protein [Terriglobales bacterium]